MGVRRLLSWNPVVAFCAAGCCLLGTAVGAQAASSPVIESESAYDVTLDAGTLQAQLNPEGSETPAGLPDNRAYELISPVDKGGGEIDGGAVAGDASVPLQASEDGSAVTYESATAFATALGEAKGAPSASTYISRRGEAGWSTQNVTPPNAATTEPDSFTVQASTIEAMSPDLSQDFFVTNSPLLPGAFPGFITPYAQDITTGSTEALLQSPPPNREASPSNPLAEFDPRFAGATNDFSHIIFTANDTLTPEATGSSEESHNLYEWTGGQLRLVNILPDGSVVSGDQAGGRPTRPTFGSIGAELRQNLDHVISADGTRIFWSDGADRKLFARVDGTSTVLISGSQKTNGTGPGGTDPLGTQQPIYQGASANGTFVLFSSTEELTNEANTGNATSCAPLAGDCTADLYRYDMETGGLEDLTANAMEGGGDLRGVVGSSEDGSTVYFVANGALAPGATPGDCSPSQGSCNLYIWQQGSGTRFIATIPSSDLGSEPTLKTGVAGEKGIAAENLEERVSRVSPNGRFLAFESKSSLTGYDNRVSRGSGCVGPEGFNSGSEGELLCPEVFLYDASSGRLACASCNPTGARPIGPSAVPYRVGTDLGQPFGTDFGQGWETATYQQRYLDDSGRLFFDTVDGLSPLDTNERADVYEYEDGEAHLISGGAGAEASMFTDASASGDDVFFVTRDRLTSQDQDEAVDLYDARVGAQPPVVSSPPCASSDACKPAASPQPGTFGPPASSTFSGAGNLTQAVAPAPAAKMTAAQPKAEKLAKALKACRRDRSKKRAACEKSARKRYGAKQTKKSRKPSGRASDRRMR